MSAVELDVVEPAEVLAEFVEVVAEFVVAVAEGDQVDLTLIFQITNQLLLSLLTEVNFPPNCLENKHS